MTFIIDVEAIHLQRLAKRLGYAGIVISDPPAFKTFVEAGIIAHWKRLVKEEIRQEEIAKIVIPFIETDIKSGI